MDFDVREARETRNFLRQQQGQGAVYAAYDQYSTLTKDNITCFKDAGSAMDFYFKNFSLDKHYRCGKIHQMIYKVEEVLRREERLKNSIKPSQKETSEFSKWARRAGRLRR